VSDTKRGLSRRQFLGTAAAAAVVAGSEPASDDRVVDILLGECHRVLGGEWKAASERGDRYWLFLVGNCSGTCPQIQRIQNPASLVQAGQAQVVPVIYRFSTLAASCPAADE